MAIAAQNVQVLDKKSVEDLIKLIEQATKPGLKTTEFWTTAFTTLTSFVTGLVGYSKAQNDWTQYIPLGIGLLISFLLTRQYTVARTEVKKVPLENTASPTLAVGTAAPQPVAVSLTGDFKTADGKTVTVKDGMVTTITS